MNPIAIPSNGTVIESLSNSLYETYGSSNNALMISHATNGVTRINEYKTTAPYSNGPHLLSFFAIDTILDAQIQIHKMNHVVNQGCS